VDEECWASYFGYGAWFESRTTGCAARSDEFAPIPAACCDAIREAGIQPKCETTVPVGAAQTLYSLGSAPEMVFS